MESDTLDPTNSCIQVPFGKLLAATAITLFVTSVSATKSQNFLRC
jgi:hypothetical protein